jgi:hypothetical protein
MVYGVVEKPHVWGCLPEAHPARERNYKLAPSLPEKAVGFTKCSDAQRNPDFIGTDERF